MAYSLGTIRKFTTRNFTVIVDAIEEDSLDLSWDDSGETAAGLDSGKFIAFVARARVLYQGQELASDYLGSCIYETLEAFADHRECGRQNREWEASGKAGRCGSYFAGMIHEVCSQARAELIKLQSVKVRGARAAVAA